MLTIKYYLFIILKGTRSQYSIIKVKRYLYLYDIRKIRNINSYII